MRRAARRDDNERGIIEALRAKGCVVVQLSQPDVPDLMCWSPALDAVVLMEVKESTGRLRPGQLLFHAAWPGAIATVRDVQQALGAAGFEVNK